MNLEGSANPPFPSFYVANHLVNLFKIMLYNQKSICIFDSANKSLYFDLDNAGKIYNAYDSIIKRYYEENKEDLKQRKIKQMKEELSKLEAQS